MPRLILNSGSAGDSGRTIDLTGDPVTIGRDATNTLALDTEAKASRRHCQVTRLPGGGYEVSDNHSTNGTRVNGTQIEKRRLNHGDEIEVGLTKIRFEDEAAVASGAATACYLEWTNTERKGERIPLTQSRTTFGRRPTCTVALQDKMASGDHAAIVKDLNGYTIQDLGSTNGTLVNGEPVTEMGLTHGSRVRIGNSKFVFKDPSMADVQVAIDSVEEDDGGWGMMAELDVSKARGGSGGLIAAIVLIGALGAGAYIASTTAGDQTAKPTTSAANLVADGSFDAEDPVSWTVDEPSPALVDRSATGGRPGGGPALVVKHDGKGAESGVARYSDDLEAAEGATYRVSAWIKRDGSPDANLALQWLRNANPASGASAVTRTVPIGAGSKTGSWTKVESVLSRPAWARSARLVVVVPRESSVRLDDLSVVAEARATTPGLAPKDADAHASTTGGLDLVRTATVIFVGAAPWARLADGRAVGGPDRFRPDAPPAAVEDGIEVKGKVFDDAGEAPATIRWKKAADGLQATVSVEGAKETGLAADFVIAHLEDGLGVQGAFGAQKLPPQADAKLEGVTRVLLGSPAPVKEINRPSTLVALDVEGGKSGRFTTERTADAGLLRVVLALDGPAAELRVLTSFDAQSLRAQEELRRAEAALQTSPGEGLRLLDGVAQKFPFDEGVRQKAVERAAKRRERASDDVKALQEARDRFLVYGDEASLADVEARVAALAADFPPPASATMSPLESSVRDLKTAIEADRAKFVLARAGAEVRRLARLAELLEDEPPTKPGEPNSKAIALAYYDAIVSRYGDLESAAGLQGPDAETVDRIKKARARRDALAADAAVAAQYVPPPPAPAAKPN